MGFSLEILGLVMSLELEAENAALQESLATLPQLQEDRAAYLKLQEHLQVLIAEFWLYLILCLIKVEEGCRFS
jgi:hypothetical protein